MLSWVTIIGTTLVPTDGRREHALEIHAEVRNSKGEHHALVTTQGTSRTIDIPPKPDGFGSSANGGELLFLALATCYCNDIYREAGKRGIRVEQVEVAVSGSFGDDGAPATDVTYRARVVAHADEAEIQSLMRQTDSLAEIQNTLRVQTPVQLGQIEAVSASQ